jgi:hypothetical protein
VSDYLQMVERKLAAVPPSGIASGFTLPAGLFGHQDALTSWALRRGRAAIFADTGLGKMLMELAWADAVRKHTVQPVLGLCPLGGGRADCSRGPAVWHRGQRLPRAGRP